jgi:hypothetical protein
MSGGNEYVLNRSGDTAVGFRGVERSMASSQTDRGPLAKRWHEISIFETDGGQFVAAIVFLTDRGNEQNNRIAFRAESEAALARLLREHDPIGTLIGYPLGVQYEAKQARLKQELINGYMNALSNALGVFEREIIS